MSKSILNCLAFVLFLHPVHAQNILKMDKNEASPKAKIDELAWIAGHWQSEAFGGIAEEIWSPPMGDAMMASFRLVSDGQTSFYEIETISEENGSLILRLKHFHANLKGWEDKDDTIDFPLVKLEAHKAFFDGMTFEKISEDDMNVYVLLKNKEGEQEMKFAYKRAE